jgi:hypothetical protein
MSLPEHQRRLGTPVEIPMVKLEVVAVVLKEAALLRLE